MFIQPHPVGIYYARADDLKSHFIILFNFVVAHNYIRNDNFKNDKKFFFVPI